MASETAPVVASPPLPAVERVDAGPLVAWRTRSPGVLAASETAELARMISATCLVGEPRWAAAARGDAAAAVAVAIRQVRSCDADSAASDLVMSNLLLVAESGDAGARPVMAFALRALARRRAGDRRLLRLAALWGRPAAGSRRRFR